MRQYDFFATHTFDGGSITDRWRFVADTFESACEMAQRQEYFDAEEYERDPIIYDTFTEVEVKND